MTCHFRMEGLVDELRVREVDLTFFLLQMQVRTFHASNFMWVWVRNVKCVISLYKKHVKFVKN